LALLVYVDDIIVASNDPCACGEVKAYLNTCLRIKDLGALKYFLAIEVARAPRGLFLCQRKYALKSVNECGMLGSKLIAFPMVEKSQICFSIGEK